jgi:ribosome maturation factor RimP
MALMTPEERVAEIANRLLASLGMELVDIEYKREGRAMVLRVYIDKPGGVNLDDCADVSRELSTLLDVEDVVPGRYLLEVSSPGLNRPLTKESDYLRYVGRLVKIRTRQLTPDDKGNMRKTFFGELLGYGDGIVRIKLKEGQTASLTLAGIAKANLEFD